MKITKQKGTISGPYRVIIASKKIDKTLTKEDQKLLAEFNKGEAEMEQISSLNEAFFLVKDNPDPEKIRKQGAEVRSRLKREVKSLAVSGKSESLFYFLEGFLLAGYQFLKYVSDKEKKKNLLQEIVVSDNFEDKRIKELKDINKAVSWARDMVNEPVSFLSAEQLADEIVKISEQSGFSAKVLQKTQIESLKMGGILAVNQGSIDEPTFTILEYKPKEYKNKKPIVLVGKGVVYDTGGLSLKPTANSMDIMKSDMAGAAAVAGAIHLTALQKLPVHVIGLIPATDNRPGLNAYAPGDIVTMFDGTTVEVLNTDAEGRMILADALAYSAKYNPELVVDAATLTGAAHRAIGEHAAIVMGNADEHWFEKMEQAGKSTHERVVRFPFWDDYLEEMKSPIADLNNLGGASAGMITAGKFLEHFVKAPYLHLDIAGPAWLGKNDAYRTRGGSGYGVRLLYNFLKNSVND